MKNEEMALLFSEATPYIQKYHGKTLVIKYGGNAMVNDELKLAVMNDLVTLTLLGVRVVLVHGGGPAINKMLARVGKESKFVGGLRYTDEETMGIVQQVLAGQVNKDLVALLKGRGVGLCGMDGHTITCSRKSDVDLGYVGEIEKVDTTLIEHLLADSFIPVIATVGMDDNGIPYMSLCFAGLKDSIQATVHIDDSPSNVNVLRKVGQHVVVFDQPYNRGLSGPRMTDWSDGNVDRLLEWFEQWPDEQ